MGKHVQIKTKRVINIPKHLLKKLKLHKEELLKQEQALDKLKKEKPAPDGHYKEEDGTIKKIIDNIDKGLPYLL